MAREELYNAIFLSSFHQDSWRGTPALNSSPASGYLAAASMVRKWTGAWVIEHHRARELVVTDPEDTFGHERSRHGSYSSLLLMVHTNWH